MRRPRWLIAHLLVVTLTIAFVILGFWQLARWGERRLDNQVLATRLAADPLPLEQLVASVGSDLSSLAFRRSTTEGHYHPEHEVLVRSQVHDGVAGFHVVTPLVLAGGEAILVNRGWVPLAMDTVPSPAQSPDGLVPVTGWLRVGEGREAPGGSPDENHQVTRVDVTALEEGLPWSLLPLYLVSTDGNADTLPTPIAQPDIRDEGPHLAYAVQWFSFVVIGVIGYVFLLRRALRRR